MSEYAPQAIHGLFDAIHAKIPQAVLSGILGDASHTYGYHRARAVLPSGDYSVQLGPDKLGDQWAASALDISLPPDLMKTCTARLLAAAKANDPRLAAVREFCGTLNGTDTFPWDLSTDTGEGVNTWDSSHLWHVHLSIYREYANDTQKLLPIADVFAGTPTTAPEDDMATPAEVWGMHIPNPINPAVSTTPLGLLDSMYKMVSSLNTRVTGLQTELDATKAELDAYVKAHP